MRFVCLLNSCHSGDRVIFAESPSAPGVPIVYRLPEERQANPDRLNLDRYLMIHLYVFLPASVTVIFKLQLL